MAPKKEKVPSDLELLRRSIEVLTKEVQDLKARFPAPPTPNVPAPVQQWQVYYYPIVYQPPQFYWNGYQYVWRLC